MPTIRITISKMRISNNDFYNHALEFFNGQNSNDLICDDDGDPELVAELEQLTQELGQVHLAGRKLSPARVISPANNYFFMFDMRMLLLQ